MSEEKLTYERILLKLSGESLLGSIPFGIDVDTTKSIAKEIKEATKERAATKDKKYY